MDIGTGDFLQHFSVLSLPGSLPLTLSRFTAHRPGTGIFGPKWTDEWSASLTIQGNRLHFTDSEGVVLYYRLPQDGIFRGAVNSRRAYYRLTGSLRDGVSVFDRRSQQTQLFPRQAMASGGCPLSSIIMATGLILSALMVC